MTDIPSITKATGLQKIISGGQTGVDRAALDFAIDNALAHGGWCPKGRKAEDGPIPGTYALQETDSRDYTDRTKANVRDSAATLIITWGAPRGGTAVTLDAAAELQKPVLVCDLSRGATPGPTRAWLESVRPTTLNIAGPRESDVDGLYALTRSYLACVFAEDPFTF